MRLPFRPVAALSLIAPLGTAALSLKPVSGLAETPSAPAASSDACARLAGLRLKDVRIASATSLAEGAAVPNSGLLPMFGKMPQVGKAPAAFRRVVGHIRPAASSDIGFEVWLPAGRQLAAGDLASGAESGNPAPQLGWRAICCAAAAPSRAARYWPKVCSAG